MTFTALLWHSGADNPWRRPAGYNHASPQILVTPFTADARPRRAPSIMTHPAALDFLLGELRDNLLPDIRMHSQIQFLNEGTLDFELVLIGAHSTGPDGLVPAHGSRVFAQHRFSIKGFPNCNRRGCVRDRPRSSFGR
jgi:hypothetical protein